MPDLHFLANPARFRRFAQKVLPALSIVTALALAKLVATPPGVYKGGKVLLDASKVKRGQLIKTRLSKGELTSAIE